MLPSIIILPEFCVLDESGKRRRQTGTYFSPSVIPRKKAGLLETYSSNRLVDFPANI